MDSNMNVFRIIDITILSVSLITFLSYHIFQGIQTGKIRHTDSSKFYSRKTQPVKYWLIIILFFVLNIIFLSSLILVILK